MKGELEQARFFAERATQLNPGWDLPFGLLSWIALLEGDEEGGVSCLKHAYALCPDSPQNCWDLGEAYAKVGSMKEAKDYISQAIDLCPELVDKDDNLDLAQKLEVVTDKPPKDESTC